MKYVINTKSEMVNLARDIASKAKRGDVFLLKGKLGVGKTFFARAFINYFVENKEKIVSPTFNLLKIYKTKHFKIYHFDLYRIKKRDELYEIGIEEALEEGVCLIEWPELVYEFLNKKYKEIKIEIVENGGEEKRIVIIKSF